MHSSWLRGRATVGLLSLGLAATSTLVGAGARAHSVRVDGDAADWMSRAPNTTNLSIVARDASQQGEVVWLDARLDARNDLVGPATETGADLQTFAVTADATNLYFRVTLGPDTSVVASPVQVQIAIDVDRTMGSGTTPFAGFADTDVAPEAAWERLVQTQGGLGGMVQVRDPAFAVLGTGTIATNTTTHETEIAIPWTLLPARSYDVLRFSVAVFRENAMGDTADVLGSSDALDAMTDYGDPSPTAPNTWVEVMDGVVNHSIDVWFDRTSREPYGPLQIARFMVGAPAPASEWVEVRNATPVTLDLSVFAFGDEETPDGSEYMARFPGGSMLASGAVAVIAENGTDFAASYGVAADYEARTGAGGPPDLVVLSTWDGPGAGFALADAGDEILVLGWNRTITDVVPFQLGSYPGVTSRPAPGSNRIAVRDPVTRDTDNCVVDFPTTVDDCGPGAGTCTTCRACTRFACTVDTGAACDDGDMCTTGTTCSAAAVCGGGSALSCDDSNSCTTDSCSSSTGCQHAISMGALCNDGDACTTADMCTAAGMCAGTAVSCDDANPCTDDACGAGGCTHTVAVGRACSDGSMCTSSDACNAMGACVGVAITCMDDGNPCTTEMCVAASGCTTMNNTAACDDGNPCTSTDVCGGGACTGTPRVCNDGNGCTSDACAMATGLCTFTPSTGTACDDGSACTTGDMCDATGACVGTVSCDAGGPLPDAGATEPDAFVLGEDAGASGDDAGMSGEDAGMGGEDAAMTTTDAGPVTTSDAGAADAGPMDGGRRDGGAAVDAAGSGLPPMTGGCACRVGGQAPARAPLAWAFGLLGLAVVLRRSTSRRRPSR
ncbi:MAG: lamin tail domain-containing protein [Sandaracinaceae bacterium]|nr:lamin tail domain-containing protein [Sandaracinaceae bacterium]